jgi:Na+-transporting NADH:ubiquinone oxidoreductase subunit A
MHPIYKIRKGFNINISGKAEKFFGKVNPSELYAVKPVDFHGLVPRLMVKEGSEVKAGTVLFVDKYQPEICFTAPVSGTVVAVNRGERRAILEVVVKADCASAYENFEVGNPFQMKREEIAAVLLKSGLWPSIRQRPYNIIADPERIPKAIFISAFDTAPLAPDYDFMIQGAEKDFQAGVDVLSVLVNGKVHINVSDEYPASSAFTQARNAQTNYFRGPHPAGDVSIQIQKIDPLNKGEVVWFIRPQAVVTIGRLFIKGVYDASRIVAVTGSEVLNPRYYRIISGASVKSLVNGKLNKNNHRFISGNPLTGTQVTLNGFLGYYDSHLSVIPEGDYSEFMGWAMPGFSKYSLSRSFWSWLAPDLEYKINTNTHGSPRPFVLTGIYEKLFPLDIYPMQLLKAIMAGDIDQMERLGIYEVAEEDFALCEFACPSKIEMQALIRKGLDMMKKEMS